MTIKDPLVTVKRNELGMVFEFDESIRKICKYVMPERRVYPAIPPKVKVKKGEK